MAPLQCCWLSARRTATSSVTFDRSHVVPLGEALPLVGWSVLEKSPVRAYAADQGNDRHNALALGHVDEAGVVALKGQHDIGSGAISVFSNNEVSFAGPR